MTVRDGLWAAAIATGDTFYVLRIQPDLAFEFVSDSVESLLGYAAQEFLDDPSLLEHLVDPRDRGLLAGALTAPVGSDIEVQLRWVHRDGHPVWTLQRARTRLRDDSTVVLEGSGRDITGMREAQDALTEDASDVRLRLLAESTDRARLRATLDSLLDPHVLLEAVRADDGRIVDFVYADANDAACTYVRMEHGDLIGARLLTLLPGIEGSGLLAMFVQAVETGRPLVLDGVAYANELVGDDRRYDIRAIRVGDSLSFTWRDVTDRHAAARELAAREEYYRLLAENSSDVVVRLGPDGAVQWVSPSVETTLGWAPADFAARSLRELMHPDDLPRILAVQQDVLARGGSEGRGEARYATPDGGWRWMSVVGRVVRDGEGRIVGAVDSLRDIEAEVAARQALARSEERFRLLAESASDVVYMVRLDGVVDWVSPSIRDALGWDPHDVEGTRPWELMHPDDRPHAAATLAETVQSGTAPPPYLMRLRHVDGSYRWMSASGHGVRSDGVVVGFVVGMRDVTAQIEADEARRASEERFRLAMVEAPQGMAILDLDRRFIEVNAALCRIVGRDRDWLLGHGLGDVLHPDDEPEDAATRQTLLDGERDYATADRRYVRGDNAVIWVQHSIGLLRDAHGQPTAYVSQMQDITANRDAVERLAYLATHDRLTGVLNREELTVRLERELVRRPRTGTRLAVLFCDIDNLKTVNDTLGHAAGDALLVAVSTAITETVRSTDIVARVGGDEFVIVLNRVHDQTDAEQVAAQVRAAAARPVPYDRTELRPTLSVGLAMPAPGQDVDAALRDADIALYAAKAAGRDRVVAYSVDLDRP